VYIYKGRSHIHLQYGQRELAEPRCSSTVYTPEVDPGFDMRRVTNPTSSLISGVDTGGEYEAVHDEK
jgi:hypothetical protein